MKLNWKKALLGLFVGVGMTMMPACSNDEGYDADGNGEGKEVTEPAEMGYLSMKFSLGSVGTKDLGTEVGRSEEQKVQEVWLVLYGPTNTVEYRIELTASNAGGTFSGSDVSTESVATSSRFVTVGQPVEKQAYKMLVLVNPASSYASVFGVGQPYDEDAIYSIQPLTSANGWAEDDHFFMSNAQGLIDIATTDLKSSATDAERHPKAVAVDRGVAKVVVDGTSLPTVPTGDAISNLFWGLDITNKSSYWVRHMGLLSDGTPEETNDGSARYARYAEDPNFSGVSGTSSLTSQFNYLNEAPYYKSQLPVSYSGTVNYMYALENTMDAADQKQDVTTRVVLGGRYIPKGFSEDTWGNSFFTYAGKVINGELMANYAGNASLIPDELKSAGLAEAIAKVKAEKGSTIFDTSSGLEAYSSNGINYYANGVCYYTVMLRHFTNDQLGNLTYGRYGVVRNNVYKLTIKSLSGVGTPIVDVPGPNPNDGETSIAADIQVLPWQIRNQEVEDL